MKTNKDYSKTISTFNGNGQRIESGSIYRYSQEQNAFIFECSVLERELEEKARIEENKAKIEEDFAKYEDEENHKNIQNLKFEIYQHLCEAYPQKDYSVDDFESVLEDFITNNDLENLSLKSQLIRFSESM